MASALQHPAAMRRIVVALISACSGGDAPRDATVAPSEPPPWPIYDQHRCSFLDEDGCLLDRYTRQWEALQGREVGGMEEMLGEAFAGSAAVAAAITPKDGPPTVARCNELPHDWVTVGAEHLRRPQRDCFFDCVRGADPATCAIQHHCAHLPVVDGHWELIRLQPRLGCLAQIATADARCADQPAQTQNFEGSGACEPRRMCADGASGVPATIQPYVIAGDPNCTVRPQAWWCDKTVMEFPRATCLWGRW